MENKEREGQFEVIDSFAIRQRGEFYLIGRMANGIVQPDWFVTVPLNASLGMTVRISTIENVEFPGEKDPYLLLTVKNEEEVLDFLLGLNIGSELLDVTVEGSD